MKIYVKSRCKDVETYTIVFLFLHFEFLKEGAFDQRERERERERERDILDFI